MKNDGFVRKDDVMPFLLHYLAYWGGEDVYRALEKMPILSSKEISSRKEYVKKSSIMCYLLHYLAYWGEYDVRRALNSMPTINGLAIKLYLFFQKNNKRNVA